MLSGPRVERLHPLALVSGIGTALRQMIGAVFAGGFIAFQGRPGLGLLILVGLVASTAIGILLHWWRLSYTVGDDEVRIDSGIVSRTRRILPFDRVEDVSIEQGPLQRVFGVAKVTLETGGSAAGKEEGVLGAVRLERAQALRDHVRTRRSGLAAGVAPTGELAAVEAEEPILFAMDGRRLLTLGFFNFSLALFGGLFAASQTVGDVLGIDPFERSFWRPLLENNGVGAYLLDHRLGLALSGVVVLIFTGIVTGAIRTFLREYGFRLSRTANGLRRRRGLLTKSDVSLPARRIQAGLIRTGPLRERLGYRELKVQSLAQDIGGGGDHVLVPLGQWDEIAPVAERLRWRLPDAETGWRPVDKAHLWAFLAWFGPLIGLIGLAQGTALTLSGAMDSDRNPIGRFARDAGGIEPAALLILGFVLAVGVIGALLRWSDWRHTGWALEDGRLLVRTGWWQRRTLLLPLTSVQSVDLSESGLARRFGIATLVIGVAGGSSHATHRVPSLRRDEASLLRRRLLHPRP